MSFNRRYGVICLLLLIFLTGICTAVEKPANLIYIQGGKSNIADGGNGTSVITVKDVVPYFYISDNTSGTDKLVPVEKIDTITYPLNAALLFYGENNERSFIVEVSDLSFSDGNRNLTLHVNPLEFYEGNLLKNITSNKSELEINNEVNGSSIGIYLEMNAVPPENANYPLFDPK